MSPLQIEIMLHYQVCGDDYREGDFDAPAVRDAIEGFKQQEMLREAHYKNRCYEITAKGHAYVKALCAVPEPHIQWVVDYPTPESIKAMEG